MRIFKQLFISLILTFTLNIYNGYCQEELRNYTRGFYVSNNNDTINGYLKYLSLSSSCSRVRFKKDENSKAIDIYPHDIKAYKRDDEYFISKNISTYDTSSLTFIKPIIIGELSLFRRWVARGSQYGSSDVLVSYIELKGEEIIKVKKTNFRKTVSSYLGSNTDLSLKILNKKLDIYDIELIVDEYNAWFQNGALTNNDLSNTKEIQKILGEISESKLAIELPLSISKSFILIEPQLAKLIDVEEKLSTDIGIGLRYSATDEFKLRLGVHYWILPINPSYEASGTDDLGNEITLSVVEESQLNSIGVYFHMQYEGTLAFIGGGLNIGISNSYKTEISYYDQSNDLIFSESNTKSLLTDEFKNQSHFEIITGLKFNTKTNFSFKPFVRASIPFKPLFGLDAPDNTAYDMYAVVVNLGVILDIGLINK